MTGNGNHTICENGDDWGMRYYGLLLFYYGLLWFIMIYYGLLWFIMFHY